MPRLLRLRPLASALAVACSLALFASTGSAQYTATNLVSNTSLYSPVTLDPNLIDGWGLAALPDSPWWLSSQNTSSSPLYTAHGAIEPMVVDIPCVISGTPTVPCSPLPGVDEPNNLSDTTPPFGPAGIVANTFSKAFKVNGAAAQFIFSTQDGLIVAWNTSVSPSTQSVVEAKTGALYQGLAIAGPAHDPHLYATNVVGGIDVFDKDFTKVNTFNADSVTGFGPYGIQTIGTNLYVTYFSIVASAGILDVCDLETSLTKPKCRRLYASNLSVSAAVSPILASPWGIALAPNDFGPLSNMLLVGNVDDGLINAFDPDTGRFVGPLNLRGGTRFSVPGLWGLAFGKGNPANGPRNHLFFSSGPSPVNGNPITTPDWQGYIQQYGAGLFGVITPNHP
jgi:uncharacterized protein (TIGR03118 family)